MGAGTLRTRRRGQNSKRDRMPRKETPVSSRAAPKSFTGGTRLTTSLAASLTSSPAQRRRVVVIGAPSDVPRALMHPAVVEERFLVRAVLSVDVDIDDSDE